MKNTVLIIDRTTTHFCNYLNSLFKKYDSHYLRLPPGLARYLQPLGVAINKPFKQAMKKSDCEFRIKYADDEIIKHVVLIWYDDQTIKKETIIRSFKLTGISIKMNGEENAQISIPEQFIDNLSMPDNLDYTDLNDYESTEDYELFKCLKNLIQTQPTINSYFNKRIKDTMDLDN